MKNYLSENEKYKEDAKSSIDIVFITDESYVLPTGVAISSLEKNRSLSKKYNVYIICDNVPEKMLHKFALMERSNFAVIIKKIDSAVMLKDVAGRATHVSKSAMIKFFLPEIFVDLDKILYLDGDIIIQKDLSDLYNTDIRESYIAAVRDIIVSCKDIIPVFAKLGLERKIYFNSGVMLLNLKLLREDKASIQLLEYRENGANYFMDQDALNVILGRKLAELSPNNNDLISAHEQCKKKEIVRFFDIRMDEIGEGMLRDTTILHFASPFKPWKYYMPIYTELFLDYQKSSPFSEINLKLEQRPKPNLLKKTIKWILINVFRSRDLSFLFYKPINVWRGQNKKIKQYEVR